MKHHCRLPALVRNAGAVQQLGRDGRSKRSLNAEWVTVKNTGRLPVSLKGWTLADKSGHTYLFSNLCLRGHQSVRVHTGIGHDTHRDVYQDRRAYVWDNNGDTATLRNNHHRIIDINAGATATDPPDPHEPGGR